MPVEIKEFKPVDLIPGFRAKRRFIKISAQLILNLRRMLLEIKKYKAVDLSLSKNPL